jgi:hypothetical protein
MIKALVQIVGGDDRDGDCRQKPEDQNEASWPAHE